MPIKPGSDPDILTNRVGGGCLSLFGLPFLFAGIVMLFAAFSKSADAPGLVMVPFSLIFTSVGAAFVFGRSQTVINRRAQTLTATKSLLSIPVHTKTHQLVYYNKVNITSETRSSKNGSYTVYPVRLEGVDNVPAINIEENRDYETSRQTAESLGKFLQKPVVDYTAGTESVRAPEDLDRSFREVALKTVDPDADAFPAPPDGMKATVRREGSDVVVDIPTSGFKISDRVSVIVPLIFGAFVLFIFGGAILSESGMPLAVKGIFIGFILVFFVAMPTLISWFAVSRKSKGCSRIRANSSRLCIEGPNSKTINEISVDEIEEFLLDGNPLEDIVEAAVSGDPQFADPAYAQKLKAAGIDPQSAKALKNPVIQGLMKFAASSVGAKSGITVRGDKRALNIPLDLPQPEVAYIYEILKRAMVSGATAVTAETSYATPETDVFRQPDIFQPAAPESAPQESIFASDAPTPPKDAYGDRSGFRDKY